MKFVILFFTILLSSLSYSQDEAPVPEEKNFVYRWWNNAKKRVTEIYDVGQNDFYLTGYAYHDRWTYTNEKLKDLNEGAYGFGFGRSRVNKKGNTEMIYGMTHLDSHKDIQVNVGYAWLKTVNIFGDVKLGGGFTASLVSRSDFAGHFPLPIVLPMGAIDFGRVSINGILVPKLNDGINNGNVLFLFAKFTWDQEKTD